MSVAYINAGVINLGTLINNMGVSVDTTDSNGNPINICSTTGNFLGATLDQVINAVVACINAGTGTHGFTATNVNPRIKVDYAASSLAGISITLNFSFYFLRHDEENLPEHTDIGYSSFITGRCVLVRKEDSGYSDDLVYAPSGDSYQNFNITKNFDTYTDGSIHTINIGAGKSDVVFANNEIYKFIHFGASTYVVNFQITGTGYNSGTGDLEFTISTILKSNVSNTPIDSLGSVTWQVYTGAVGSPVQSGWGTINVFTLNRVTGNLTYIDFIEVHADTIREGEYDMATNAVFFCCGGAGLSQALKISLSSPLVVASLVPINPGGGLYGLNLRKNPFFQIIHMNSGNNVISKFNTNTPIGYNSASNITGGSFSSAASMTFDDSNGDMIYAPDIGFNSPNIYRMQCSASLTTIDPYVLLMALSDYDTPALYTTGALKGVNGEGLHYYRTATRLYVMRNTSTNQVEMQSYDISSGNNTTINATKVTYQMPFASSIQKMTWSQSEQKLFITTDYLGGTVFFLNPVTDTFDASNVTVPMGISWFSFTEDSVTPNFLASIGGAREWLSIISKSSPENILSGVFLNEALNGSNCPFCYEYPLIACYDNYIFDLDLLPNTVYNIILTDKFQKKYRRRVTSDADGKIILDPENFPDGFFTPENGDLGMEITDENNLPVEIIFGYNIYTCLTLTFEYNNLIE